MTLRDLFLDTLRTLWAHKLRTALTMFGIAWGIVSITLMVAAGEGLREGQKIQAETLGKDIMIVWAGRTSLQAGGARAGRVLRWVASDADQIRQEATACEQVLPELSKDGSAVSSSFNNATLQVSASLPAFSDIRSVKVAEGRFYSDEDNREARRVTFIGSDAKKQLFGSGNAVGETVMLRGYPYRVIGVMQHKEQDSSYDGRDVAKLFVPIRAALRDFPDPPPKPVAALDQLLVQPRSVELHDECKAQLRRTLARLYNFDPRDKEAIPIWDTMEEAKAFRQMTDGMKYFLGAVGVTTLMLGGLGVMNVMLVAVRERTREIGVRKAVGATSGSILGQFFAETMIIVLLSGAVGMGIAFGFCALVNLLPMPPFFAGLRPSWQSSLLSLALLGLTAVGSALYPAGRAAATDPIEALRFEAGG